jgi:hypothetical protein
MEFFCILKTTIDKQGDYYMSTSGAKGEWTEDLGTIWGICIFTGVFMGGVGLFFTITIAIFYTIFAFWKDIIEERSDTDASSHYHSYGSGIENFDTMDIPHSGYSATERRAEYVRRRQSPSGFINGVYNDQNRPRNVPYYDGNRDWGADD